MTQNELPKKMPRCTTLPLLPPAAKQDFTYLVICGFFGSYWMLRELASGHININLPCLAAGDVAFAKSEKSKETRSVSSNVQTPRHETHVGAHLASL